MSRPNEMTTEEWLGRILDSGLITRVTQHLALVIFALAVRQQQHGVSASVRDLERITGWSKSMIADHLEELGDFIKKTPGAGRKKSMFELQALVEDAVKAMFMPLVSANARTQAQDSVRQRADATADTKHTVRPCTDAIPDTKPSVLPKADAIPDTTESDEPPSPPKRKVSPCTPSKENNPPIPDTHTLAPARDLFAEPYLPSPAAMRNPTPHMNGVGFVISEPHGLTIPLATVARWRDRFADLPDLEAAMGRLSCNLLSRGTMHPGWSSPEGWMAGILADMNQQAKDKRRVADAKVAANKPKSFKPSRW